MCLKVFCVPGRNLGLGSKRACAELSRSVALRKCVFFYIKLEIAPKLHTLLIYHEIEQLDHQGYHLAHPFHVMKFTARKSRIQKEKTGCCGQGGKDSVQTTC